MTREDRKFVAFCCMSVLAGIIAILRPPADVRLDFVMATFKRLTETGDY